MKVYNGFDETIYKKIASSSGSRQAVKDVAYQRLVFFRNASKSYAKRIDDIAFICGCWNKDHLRIVCVAVDVQYQRQGLGSALLYTAMDEAKRRGYKSIKTKTYSGQHFYSSAGFVVVGMQGKEYLMEAIL